MNVYEGGGSGGLGTTRCTLPQETINNFNIRNVYKGEAGKKKKEKKKTLNRTKLLSTGYKYIIHGNYLKNEKKETRNSLGKLSARRLVS